MCYDLALPLRKTPCVAHSSPLDYSALADPALRDRANHMARSAKRALPADASTDQLYDCFKSIGKSIKEILPKRPRQPRDSLAVLGATADNQDPPPTSTAQLNNFRRYASEMEALEKAGVGNRAKVWELVKRLKEKCRDRPDATLAGQLLFTKTQLAAEVRQFMKTKFSEKPGVPPLAPFVIPEKGDRGGRTR